ncbi:RDD family protein [Catelliglobosispora koreensis]|uniref:hypothetical protein n=1 Tax=Catelliglobosispora koreensis TaxID=129052 RepID=UPI00039F1EC6
MMKLRVIGLDGQPLSWGGAALRVYIQAIASSCTCGVGGLLFALSPLFDNGPWKRGWPDQIASSVVVQTG